MEVDCRDQHHYLYAEHRCNDVQGNLKKSSADQVPYARKNVEKEREVLPFP